jgi:hypothetical protein
MIFTWVGENIHLRYGYLVPYAIMTFKAGFIVKALVLNFLRSLQEIFVNTTPSHPCFFFCRRRKLIAATIEQKVFVVVAFV